MSPSFDTLPSAPSRLTNLVSPKNVSAIEGRLQKTPGLEAIAQKTINPTTSPEEQKKLQKLLAESIAKISLGLKAKFDTTQLNIDITDFEKAIK